MHVPGVRYVDLETFIFDFSTLQVRYVVLHATVGHYHKIWVIMPIDLDLDH